MFAANQNRSAMIRKYLALSVGLLAAAALAHAQQIGHTQITYTDPARSNRQIQTEIYYPAATAQDDVPVTGGPYPVIVFGHGFVMVWSAYQNIWTNLVPQGYIVAFPRTEGNVSPVHQEFGNDLAFLVGKLQSESSSNASSLFYGKVNSRSAIMGHSMGGGSSFLAAAGNTNITTMVSFAAANTNPSSITAAQQVSVPSLVIAGQNDCVAPPAQHQVPMYDSLASSCKAYVAVTGGGHCYFAENNFNCSFGEGTCTPNPTITRQQQQDAAQDMAGMWLAYFLKDDCAAWTAFHDSLSNSARITGQSSCSIGNPVITQNGNTLQSTPAASYQWLLNGSPVPGATQQNYSPVQAGNYSVQVTYTNNCPYTSNIINWLSTGFAEAISESDLAVFPNPAQDFVSIRFRTSGDASVLVSLCSITGEMILAKNITAKRGLFTETGFDLTGISQGIYLLKLESGGHTVARKLVK